MRIDAIAIGNDPPDDVAKRLIGEAIERAQQNGE